MLSLILEILLVLTMLGMLYFYYIQVVLDSFIELKIVLKTKDKTSIFILIFTFVIGTISFLASCVLWVLICMGLFL